MSKRSHKTVGSRFFLLFLLDDRRMIEGSGSITLTNGSESGRPKNKWIRWIQIQIKNTVNYYMREERNAGLNEQLSSHVSPCDLE
jgi:hypothetical protein